MQIKSKYKIARRVSAPIFEKTQTQKYALREGRRKEKTRKHPKTFTDFGREVIEKQKLRYTYLLNERQLRKYVDKALSTRGAKQDEALFSVLESRLDNVAYRIGFAPTRLAIRQLVSHGHLTVNGHRVNVPSHPIKVGDVIGIRTASGGKKIFEKVDERIAAAKTPGWIAYDAKSHRATVTGTPKYIPAEVSLDLTTVLQYYKR